MEENEEKKNISKKIIINAITIAIAIIFSVIVLASLYIVTKPVFQKMVGKSSTTTEEGETSYTDDETKFLATMKEAYEMLSKKYFGDVDIYQAEEDAISGLANSTGDIYTRYVTEEEYNSMLEEGNEEFVGIGVHITYDKENNAIIVVGVIPDSPAAEAGVQKGDLILKVDDMKVTYDSYTACVEKLRGQEGTVANILVKRDGNEFEMQVDRKKINNNNVESEILDGNIGYIKILEFENGVYSQFKKEYTEMLPNINALIIDLRDNPGGLITQTIKMLDLLLPEGDVLKLVYKDGTTKLYRCSDDTQIEIPLVVLVNSSSASASEIFASAIKDSGKGILIGEKTYGKGIVQEVEKLSNGGALSVTVAKYYTMSGVEIHGNGIEPNITVELPEDVKNATVVPTDKDTQLQAAINYINENK